MHEALFFRDLYHTWFALWLFVSWFLNCSALSFSVCLGSATSDRERSFQNPWLKQEKWPFLLFTVISNYPWKLVWAYSSTAVQHLKTIWFRLVVLAAFLSMPCGHNRHLELYVSRKFSTYFSLVEWMCEISRSTKNHSMNEVSLLCSCQ